MHSARPFDPLWIIPKRISNIVRSDSCIPKRSLGGHHRRMERWWERARRAMKDRGVTQSDVAEKFEMTPAGVQKWLSGAREPSLDDLVMLADMLKMPRAELLLGTEPGDDIGDLPPYARDPLRRLARGARAGQLSREWFARFEHALEAISPSGEVSNSRRLDYRSAAIGLATALDLKHAEIPYTAFIRQVDTIVAEQESPARSNEDPAAPSAQETDRAAHPHQ